LTGGGTAHRTLASYARPEGWLGRTVHYAAQAGSTNDIALAAGRRGAAAGLVVITEEQTAGRGRLQRRWEAPPGSSLLISMLFRPPAPFARTAARMTMICGLALAAAVRQAAGVEARIKWPNDLIVDVPGRYAPPGDGSEGEGPAAEGATAGWAKLAGMLSEIGLSPEGVPAFLVVGIGLNVNVPAPVLPSLGPNATSLLALGGRPVDRAAVLDALLGEIEWRHAALARGDDPLADWRAALAWMGEPVVVRAPGDPDHPVVGRAVGVDEEGALLVRLPGGEARRFTAGDVSLRPAQLNYR
jgi:BirA family biotin operon repressor/biotin-[acetyl-CoA-carboxylase] ligase